MDRTNRPVKSRSGASKAEHVRVTVRVVVGLLIWAVWAGLCSAGTANQPSQAGSQAGPIRDPMNPQAYMRDLASRMSKNTDTSVLLRGIKAPPPQPRPTPKPKAPPRTRPIASRRQEVVPKGLPGPSHLEGLGVLAEAAMPAPPTAPTPAITPTRPILNGLSPTNRAAQLALRDLNRPPEGLSWAQPVPKPSGPVPSAPTRRNQAVAEVLRQLTMQRPDPPEAQGQAGAPQPEARPRRPVARAKPQQQPTLSSHNRAAQRALAESAAPQSSFLREELEKTKPGISLYSKPTPAQPATATEAPAVEEPQRAPPRAKEPWSLGADLDKYRSHAVAQGSRESGESLGKALEQAGLTLEDGVNIFLLGYGSDRGKPFRGNDGKGLLDEPGKAPAQAGATIISLGDGIYSLADLITLDALPDHEKNIYSDNHPLVRPFVFTGQAIHGAWKTTEEVGNAVTWGYFDNVTGTIGMVLADIIELLKHTGEAVTNLARLPIRLITGEDEGAEEAMDWVLLVPLEFVSNSVAMQGIANMQDYENAFADKGVIGSTLELAGSTFVIYWAVDELLDELDDNGNGKRSSEPAEPQPSPEPELPNMFVGDEVIVGEPMPAGGAELYVPLAEEIVETSTSTLPAGNTQVILPTEWPVAEVAPPTP